MSACVPGQAALASEVERGATGESGEMAHCQGRVMGFTIVITQELLDFNLYIQMFKWDLQYMADISP
jgi:hypothetical protein